MSSNRPYLIRALYEWIVDNSMTPHLIVNAHTFGTVVPTEHVSKEGQIILNVAPRAVQDLQLGNKKVAFSARFGGVPTPVSVPCHAVIGIYARENGQGMMFDNEMPPRPDPGGPEDMDRDNSPSSEDTSVEPDTKKPTLRVVK